MTISIPYAGRRIYKPTGIADSRTKWHKRCSIDGFNIQSSLQVNRMTLSRETQDLARRLLEYEASADESSESKECKAFRVSEDLRRLLCTLVGPTDYRSFLARALTLAKVKAPSLAAVQVTLDGSLQGLDDVERQSDQQRAGEAEVILLAQVLEVFRSFLGGALTVRLVQNASPALEAAIKSNTAGSFDDVLREVEQLTNASERLEALAGQHPDAESAIVSILASVRNSATILEVLALVKNKSVQLPENVSEPQQSKRYLM